MNHTFEIDLDTITISNVVKEKINTLENGHLFWLWVVSCVHLYKNQVWGIAWEEGENGMVYYYEIPATWNGYSFHELLDLSITREGSSYLVDFEAK